MPVQGLALYRACLLKQGNEADAVEMLKGFERQASHREHRRVKIGAGDGRCRYAAGGGHAGPFYDHRFPNTAFIQPAFSRAQRQIGRRVSFRRAQPAVVRHEDDDGIFCQPRFVQGVQDLADGLVHGFDHCRIDGVILHQAHLA